MNVLSIFSDEIAQFLVGISENERARFSRANMDNDALLIELMRLKRVEDHRRYTFTVRCFFKFSGI